MSKRPTLTEPIVTTVPHDLMEHGHKRNDPYYWMNQRDSTEVLDNLQEENSYCEEYFEPINGLVQGLVDEFDARIDPNDVSAPFILQGITYQVRQIEGKDYQQIVRIIGETEHVFLDENERAAGHPFYELADWSPSMDDQFLAISEDFIGRRKYQIRFRNNHTGEFLTDLIEDTDGSIVWANDHQTIFYIKKDPETLREFQVFRHRLGTDSSMDQLVFQEDDERYYVSISKSLTDTYVMIHCFSSLTSEVSLVDADHPETAVQVFLPRQQGHLYEVAHHESGFYILSNDKAPNKKILFSSDFPANLESCEELVGHDASVLIEGINAFQDFLLIEERQNGLRKFKIKTATSERYISFEEECYFLGLGVNDAYETKRLFYTYNSLTTPSSVFEYEIETGDKKLWFQKSLLDPNFNPADYQSERVWALANDGTKIPVSLVYKKGIDRVTAPCLLYGY